MPKPMYTDVVMLWSYGCVSRCQMFTSGAHSAISIALRDWHFTWTDAYGRATFAPNFALPSKRQPKAKLSRSKVEGSGTGVPAAETLAM